MEGTKERQAPVLYDAVHNVAMASEQQMNNDQLMKKVAKVHDFFPSTSKDDIILVLQYYEFDEDAAIDAFTEDGAAKALNEWNTTGNNKSKTNSRSKKKNKKRNKKDPVTRENLPSNESLVSKDNASANSHIEGNVSSDQHQEENHIDDECKSSQETEEVQGLRIDLCHETSSITSSVVDSKNEVHETKIPEKCKDEKQDLDEISQVSKSSDSSSPNTQSHSQQRIPPVITEDSSLPTSSTSLSSSRYSTGTQGRRGLEKCLKDLARQTAALQRVHHLLEEELENSDKRIKNAFQEVQKLLEERQAEIVQEIEKVKRDSRQLLMQRQELAVELKKRADRASSMTESDLNELRTEIKNFVVERKYDDELGRTLRFVWDRDKMTEEIRKFGEVNQVKNSYSQRRYSVSSVASSTYPDSVEQLSSVTTNLSTSVSNSEKPEENSSEPVERTEASSNSNTSGPLPTQDRYPQNHPPRQESRPRVFSNRGRWPPAYRPPQNNFNPRYLHRGRGGRGRGGWNRDGNYHNTGSNQYSNRPQNSNERLDGNFDNSRGMSQSHRSPRRDWHQRQWSNFTSSKSGHETKDSESDRDRGSGEGHFSKTESKENVPNIVNGFDDH